MSAVRAAIVAMTAGPPPLPAGADLTPPLPRADSVPGQWVNATERPAVDAGVTLGVVAVSPITAASAAGTLVTLDIYQDMVHAFHLSALPEAPPQVAITFLDRLTAWTTALRHLG